MANEPFTMNIRQVKSMVKTYDKFKFKKGKYFLLLKNYRKVNKSL